GTEVRTKRPVLSVSTVRPSAGRSTFAPSSRFPVAGLLTVPVIVPDWEIDAGGETLSAASIEYIGPKAMLRNPTIILTGWVVFMVLGATLCAFSKCNQSRAGLILGRGEGCAIHG